MLALFAGGCGADSSVTVIKLGHGLDPTHPVHQAIVYMAEQVAQTSNGTMRIDIYPSQQLGTERQLVELLQLGSLGITKVSAATMEGFAPEYKVIGMPYLFRDEEHQFRVLEGSIGEEILLSSEEFLLRGLTYYDAGRRSFYTKTRPVNTPADLAGLKIRTMESATQVQMVNALGGSATPISWGELYTALQQGVVDGAENNLPSFFLSGHYEVCRFYTVDEHSAVPDVLVIGVDVWNRLSEEEQGWLTDAALASAQVQKRLWAEASNHALESIKSAGVEVIYPDKAPFVRAVEPLYANLSESSEESRIVELVERIRATD